jgi:phosphopantetheinyl transferase (holo-ACP synthase)
VSVGNDVVDLDDPETRLECLHPRWSERVFCAAERQALDASRSRHRLHWALWAAKESAFKARKRLEPRAVFSPVEFAVELSPLPASAGVAVGRVVHRGEVFGLEIHVDDTRVHAVATSQDEAGAPVLWEVERAQGDPSVAARRLAGSAIGSALGLDPAGVGIVGRPPVAAFRDGRGEVGVSLSHHGRFVAFACTRASGPRFPDASVRGTAGGVLVLGFEPRLCRV